jgi:hypothetical protein
LTKCHSKNLTDSGVSFPVFGSEQEFDGRQAEIAFVGPSISVNSAVCERAN